MFQCGILKYRLQSFMTFSNESSSPGLQFFTNFLLLPQSPLGINCFSVGPSLPNPARKLVSVWCSLFGARTSAPAWSLPQAAGGYLIHCDPQGFGGTTWLTVVCITVCRGIFALVPGAPPPFASPGFLVSADLFLSYFLTPLSRMLLCSIFHPFINMLSQGHYLWWAQLWPMMHLSWSWVETGPVQCGGQLFTENRSLLSRYQEASIT